MRNPVTGIHDSTTLHPPTDNSCIVWVLFEINRQAENTYKAASGTISENPRSICMALCVFLLSIHLLLIQHVATSVRRLKERVANKNNVRIVWDIVRYVLEMLIIIMASAL